MQNFTAHTSSLAAEASRERTSGAAALVQALENSLVEVCFGLPGVHNLAIFTELERSSIRLVGVRHEQATAYAADGYARVSAKPGVALTTTGPGAANAVAATGEAWASGSPIVVIATDIATSLRRAGTYRGALHETRDQAAMFAPVVKEAIRVTKAEEIYNAVARAVSTSLAAPSGPVYVEIPTDLLEAKTTQKAEAQPARKARGASEAEIAAALELLQGAERPLIWAGRGCVQAGAGTAVHALAERLCAPVVTTNGARGLVGADKPLAVGLPPHVEQVGALWDRADLVIAIASDLDGVMTQNWQMPAPPSLLTINVDPVDAGKNYAADVCVQADARSGCEALADRLEPRDCSKLERELGELRETVRRQLSQSYAEEMGFVDTMSKTLSPEHVVLCDMCIPGYWLAGFYPVQAPRRLLYPMGWGTLGFAFPAAIGAALGSELPVVCVCGDGGFLYACGELATIAQEGLSVVCVIVDDSGYGMLRFDQQQSGRPSYGVDLKSPDFAALAAAFDLEVETVDGLGKDFGEALERAISAAGPRVVAASCALEPPPTTSPRWYRSRP